MSTYCVRTGVVALIVSLALGACDDNPVDDGRGDAATLSVNPDFAVVNAADTTRIDAIARDVYGEETYAPVQFSACDSKIAVENDPTRVSLEPPDRVIVIGGTLGESCVAVSGPGGLTDSATVQVLPASVSVELQDVLGSGETAAAQVTFFDVTGAVASGFDASQVNFSVADPAIAVVDESGSVTGKAPGSTDVIATLKSQWAVARSGSKTFTVNPGTFAGTATSTAGPSGSVVTYTAGGGQADFDEDTEVTVGGVKTFVFELASLTTAIPFGLPAGSNEVLFTSVGPDQLAFATTFDVDAEVTVDDLEPNDNPFAPAGPVTLPYEDLLTVDFTDIDDFIQIDLAQETSLYLFLEWDPDVNGDMDLLVVDAAFTAFQCGFVAANAPPKNPEEGPCTLPAGSYLLWVNNFAEDGLTNYHIEVTVNP